MSSVLASQHEILFVSTFFRFHQSVSYIEIYNERVYDLLKKRNELKIHEDTNGETKVNCIEKLVNSEEGIMALITEGNKERKVAETNMNTQSSRSHTIFTIVSFARAE